MYSSLTSGSGSSVRYECLWLARARYGLAVGPGDDTVWLNERDGRVTSHVRQRPPVRHVALKLGTDDLPKISLPGKRR